MLRKWFSLGHRCTSAQLLSDLKLKHESYPFDWIVSKLETVEHCILDNFKEYINLSNYEQVLTKVSNITDNETVKADNDFYIYKNKYYDNDDNIIFNRFKLANYYQKLFDDTDYYKRCIERFNNLLLSENEKGFLYIHPIIGSNDCNNTYKELIQKFIDFKKFLDTKTLNLIGTFFIIVKTENDNMDMQSYEKYIDDTLNINIFTIYTNNNFLDSSTPFAGNYQSEYALMQNLFLSSCNKSTEKQDNI